MKTSNSNTVWTKKDVQILKTRHKDGFNDKQIAEELGRTFNAVRQRRNELGYHQYKLAAKPSVKAKKKEAKYTRYMKPSTEVSILWGLVKFSKA